jgi:23S rRNA (cytidine1920-2'-O)/16S rRNA (cytidine1409-2'-O)-methyltransferase
LKAELLRRFSELTPDEAETLIVIGSVLVDGFPVRNPRSLVERGTSIRVARDVPLRGETKLRAALNAFGVDVQHAIALDLGAAAGGFTVVLLERGAARVYAVDAGHGQLLGSLRRDPRVVDLERTNLGALSVELVPDRVDVVTADLSYVSLAQALPQLNGRIELASGARLIALVKPQFELGLANAPREQAVLADAVAAASGGVQPAGWQVLDVVESPVRGRHGAIEFLLYAIRAGGLGPA